MAIRNDSFQFRVSSFEIKRATSSLKLETLELKTDFPRMQTKQEVHWLPLP
jgi:hypothetical protein